MIDVTARRRAFLAVDSAPLDLAISSLITRDRIEMIPSHPIPSHRLLDCSDFRPSTLKSSPSPSPSQINAELKSSLGLYSS